ITSPISSTSTGMPSTLSGIWTDEASLERDNFCLTKTLVAISPVGFDEVNRSPTPKPMMFSGPGASVGEVGTAAAVRAVTFPNRLAGLWRAAKKSWCGTMVSDVEAAAATAIALLLVGWLGSSSTNDSSSGEYVCVSSACTRGSLVAFGWRDGRW